MGLILSNVRVHRRDCIDCPYIVSSTSACNTAIYYAGEYVTADVENPYDGLVDNIDLRFYDGTKDYSGNIFYEIPPRTKVSIKGYLDCDSAGKNVLVWASDSNNYIPSNSCTFYLIKFYNWIPVKDRKMSTYLHAEEYTVYGGMSISHADVFRSFSAHVSNIWCSTYNFRLELISLDNGKYLAGSSWEEIQPGQYKILKIDMCPSTWVESIKNSPYPRTLALWVTSDWGVISSTAMYTNIAPPTPGTPANLPDGCAPINPIPIPGGDIIPIPLDLCRYPLCTQFGCSLCGAFCECA